MSEPERCGRTFKGIQCGMVLGHSGRHLYESPTPSEGPREGEREALEHIRAICLGAHPSVEPEKKERDRHWFLLDRWYEVEVSAKDGKFTLWLDGKEVIGEAGGSLTYMIHKGSEEAAPNLDLMSVEPEGARAALEKEYQAANREISDNNLTGAFYKLQRAVHEFLVASQAPAQEQTDE